MPRDLVPELHDVLKLTTLKHNFEDFSPFQAFAPDTPTWRGVLQHHCDESFPGYPSDRDTFLLHMADGLASNFSRHPQNIRHDIAWTIHRLWNPQVLIKDQRVQEPSDVRSMLKFLGKDPQFEDFYKWYQPIFQSRAEDAHPGMNITTLETHVRLVGRFYNFLKRSTVFRVDEGEVEQAAARGCKAVGDLRERKKKQWQLHLIQCRPRLLFSPFRARDLNVFASLEEFVGEVCAQLGDNVLSASTEEVLLYSDDLRILETLKALLANRPLALDVERTVAQVSAKDLLAQLIGSDTHDGKRKKRLHEKLHLPLEASIAPPLCEICQMQQATRVWPDDYVARRGTDEGERAEGRDYLCQTCFAIRSRPSRLTKLAHWDEWGGGDLIWVRFGLGFSQLHEGLRELYLGYLRSLDPATPEDKAEVRFSLVAEFQQDYERYLAHLRNRLLAQFGDERTEIVLPNFFCIKAETGSDVFTVVRHFTEAARGFFPAFFALDGSPLRLSLAFCAVKYPFFEFWRHWQEQEAEIEVTAFAHGSLVLKLRDVEKFLQLAQYPFRRTALHNLADISRISQALAELRFKARGEKGERDTFEHLGEFLPLGLTFEGILTLAKLKGG